MRFTAKRSFEASTQQLWQIVSDPGNMPAWNPKCVRADSIPYPRVGDRFSATFQMNKRVSECEGEVQAFRENEQITFRFHYSFQGKQGSIDESFTLKQLDLRKARLVHVVDLRNGVFPVWAKCLIWFIALFGKPTGPSSLNNIDALLK